MQTEKKSPEQREKRKDSGEEMSETASGAHKSKGFKNDATRI